MGPELIGALFAAIFSSTALAALVTGWMTRNKTSAQAAQIGAATLTALDPLVASWLNRMQEEITELQREVAKLRLLNAQLVAMLEDHDIPVPPHVNS